MFPHHEEMRNLLKNTLIDGELVLDVDPVTKTVCNYPVEKCQERLSFDQETLRFLAFDCLVIDDQNVMSKTLDKRYGVSYLLSSFVPKLTEVHSPETAAVVV